MKSTKLYLIVIGVFLLSIFISNNAISQSPITSYRPIGTNAYSFEVPSDWQGQCQSADPSSSCTFYNWASDGQHAGWIELNPEKPSEPKTLEQFVDDWINYQMMRHNNTYAVYGRSYSAMGGLRAIEYEARYTDGYTNQTKREKIIFATPDEETFYILDYNVRATYYDFYISAYEYAKSTFKRLGIQPQAIQAPQIPVIPPAQTTGPTTQSTPTITPTTQPAPAPTVQSEPIATPVTETTNTQQPQPTLSDQQARETTEKIPNTVTAGVPADQLQKVK